MRKIIKIIKNPKIFFNYFKYRLAWLFSSNILNSGERYDPDVSKRFALYDPTQEGRYNFALNFINAHDSVIDLACGTGYGSKILGNAAQKVIGYDLSKDAINYGQKKYSNDIVSFCEADFFNVKETADVVVSFETAEHINESMEKILEKLASLAKNKLIVSVPYKEEKGRNKYHLHSNLSEEDFSTLKKIGTVELYYQDFDGNIFYDKSMAKKLVINIIAVLKKNDS